MFHVFFAHRRSFQQPVSDKQKKIRRVFFRVLRGAVFDAHIFFRRPFFALFPA